jgi:hypothetical protein
MNEFVTQDVSPEVKTRLELLTADLNETFARNTKRARGNNFASLCFTWGALLASCIAATAGVFELFPSKIVGAIAIVPGIISVFPTQLKFQERAHWHFRKRDQLQGIINELRYGIPEVPTVDDIRHIADKFTALNLTMGAEWVRDIGSSDEGSAREGNLSTSTPGKHKSDGHTKLPTAVPH